MSGELPNPTVAVVIVTHNSEHVLSICLDHLLRQKRPADLVIVVDNNSSDRAYLGIVPNTTAFKLLDNASNRGFCTANNIGFTFAQSCKYVLFLNPDAFLAADFLANAVQWMEHPEHSEVGCLTGTLLGFDLERQLPTGLIDSTGIFQKPHGRWHDRGRGEVFAASSAPPEDVPAICGALMFCRTQALREVTLRRGEVFDERFFMYKEDIELSLRLRSRGWRLTYLPWVHCHHVRGWQSRARTSYRARYLSARNELRVCVRNRWRGLAYSLAKLIYVTLLERLLLDWRSRPPQGDIACDATSGRHVGKHAEVTFVDRGLGTVEPLGLARRRLK